MTPAPRFIGRRRVLRLVAGGTAALMLPGLARAAQPARRVWRGTAMGAEASIVLYDHDAERAESLLRDSVALLRGLEAVFSLHDPASALSRLNRDGAVRPAPPDLLAVLAAARRLHRATDGAFDPTVQPLWALHARHFAAGGRNEGPAPDAVAAALHLVGLDRVTVEGGGVRFAWPGMALTLNGIAQGYITDRVAERLRAAGLRHVLVDLGETRALDGRPGGSPWRIGVPDPLRPFELMTTLPLTDGAVATSSGLAAPFEPQGRHHHLFDPRTGLSPDRYKAVTVLAPSAMTADGLSTAMASMPPRALAAAVRASGATAAWAWSPDGSATRYPA